MTALKELQTFKQAMVKHNVYIFECWNCMQLMTLSDRTCTFCDAQNDYYDATLAVPPQAKAEV